MEQIYVVKQSGDREPYSEEKVLNTMKRIGMPSEMRSLVISHIKERLHPDISTSEIFSHIIEFLKERDRKLSIRLNLKQSLFELGPTGFPFEQYMAKVFESMGYFCVTDVTLQGNCVSHEIDLLLEKDGRKSIVEAKFHNQPGTKTDVHVALYTHARFLDLKDKQRIENIWIVTNTRLTVDSIHYSSCKNIRVIGWSYPDEGNLQDVIEQPRLYPVTILNGLDIEDKRKLLEEKIVLCRDFLKLDDSSLNHLMISRDRYNKAREDAQIIMGV